MFPNWTDAELVLAIEESNGDLQTTVERISEGKRSRCALALRMQAPSSISRTSTDNRL
jgi:hypothetical protein